MPLHLELPSRKDARFLRRVSGAAGWGANKKWQQELRMTQSLPEIRSLPPGPRSRELAARLAAVESPSVDARREARAHGAGDDHVPIVYGEGDGANLVDVDGNRFVDLAAGFGALLLGHRPRGVADAIERQQKRLWLALGDVYGSDAKLALCERVARLYPEPGARVMLGATGADAVTAALKSATLATGHGGVIAFEGAYHGLSHGPLAACGLRPSFRRPFADQLNPNVFFAPYPSDATSLEASLQAVDRELARGDVGAVLVEPILGRGGCVVPPREFLPGLAARCRRHGALLICDEVWTGLGRSGAWLASVECGVVPDLICLGKGLGGGFAISACVGSSRVMQAWAVHGGATIHTATHFGAPPACAAALATIDAIESEQLSRRSLAVGERWSERLRETTAGLGVAAVRGRGLMVGVALRGGSARALGVVRGLLRRGWIVLTGGQDGDVLTLTPPLNISELLLDAFATALAGALESP
jgi:4-aminobutyrate aminotransferase/(S)-3-amino-2-methylpropionate transaminase